MTFGEKVKMIEKAMQAGTIDNPMKEFGTYLDVALSWFESHKFRPEDLPYWPIFKDLLIKRRTQNFNTTLQNRNFKNMNQKKNKDMPATIDHVETHIAQSIECGGLPRYEKIFNLSKSSKTKAGPALYRKIRYLKFRTDGYGSYQNKEVILSYARLIITPLYSILSQREKQSCIIFEILNGRYGDQQNSFHS